MCFLNILRPKDEEEIECLLLLTFNAFGIHLVLHFPLILWFDFLRYPSGQVAHHMSVIVFDSASGREDLTQQKNIMKITLAFAGEMVIFTIETE